MSEIPHVSSLELNGFEKLFCVHGNWLIVCHAAHLAGDSVRPSLIGYPILMSEFSLIRCERFHPEKSRWSLNTNNTLAVWTKDWRWVIHSSTLFPCCQSRGWRVDCPGAHPTLEILIFEPSEHRYWLLVSSHCVDVWYFRYLRHSRPSTDNDYRFRDAWRKISIESFTLFLKNTHVYAPVYESTGTNITSIFSNMMSKSYGLIPFVRQFTRVAMMAKVGKMWSRNIAIKIHILQMVQRFSRSFILLWSWIKRILVPFIWSSSAIIVLRTD